MFTSEERKILIRALEEEILRIKARLMDMAKEHPKYAQSGVLVAKEELRLAQQMFVELSVAEAASGLTSGRFARRSDPP